MSRHPRRIARFGHSLPKTRMCTSSGSKEIHSRYHVTRLYVRHTGQLMRTKRRIFLLVSSVAHLTHTCGGTSGKDNHAVSNNVSTHTLRVPQHLFTTTHGAHRTNSLAVVTATLIRAGDHVSSLVFRRFGKANGVRLILGHHVTRRCVFPTISVLGSKAQERRLVVPRT